MTDKRRLRLNRKAPVTADDLVKAAQELEKKRRDLYAEEQAHQAIKRGARNPYTSSPQGVGYYHTYHFDLVDREENRSLQLRLRLVRESTDPKGDILTIEFSVDIDGFGMEGSIHTSRVTDDVSHTLYLLFERLTRIAMPYIDYIQYRKKVYEFLETTPVLTSRREQTQMAGYVQEKLDEKYVDSYLLNRIRGF